MKNYSCILHFTFSPENTEQLLNNAIKSLGFPPSIMYIKIDNENTLEDVPFDEHLLFSLLSKEPTTIQLMNREYDDNESYYWFKLRIDKEYNIIRAEWLNSSLDFLLSSSSINHFLQSANFLSGNCCDNGDRHEQSRGMIEYFINKNVKNPNDVEKIEEKIDVSKHWGRSVKTCGLEFMAAPLMWFGEKFYTVIPKDKLIQFKYSKYTSVEGTEIVTINLFNLYESPAEPENRSKQEEFWKFFKLESVISDYESKNEIDPIQALNSILGNKKKR